MERNYLHIIRGVWKWYCSSILEPNDYCLMMRLIAISNDDMGWEDCFLRNNYELCGYLKVSYKQLQNSRNKLQQVGLISFEQRNGLANCKYIIHYEALLNLSKKSEGEGKVTARLRQGEGVLKTKPNETLNINKKKEQPAVAEHSSPSIKNKKFKIENFLLPEVIPFHSEDFVSNWKKLLESPKWAKKNESAIEMAIEKMKKYNEPFVVQQIERAIIGQWQGLFFSNTDSDYQKFIQNGANNQRGNEPGGIVFDKP